ncbi:hypothetical protein PIB30_047661 [Stylosanthes scabra]|uniref:Ubiquitin-like protease family profile domain-containing protein n=1 Tax=Stylosanthes scabra TaxID=79078 RepID=A0ABU6WF79_9FABA|nr:hypothetical protein [Stylosanthes scabra]
MTRVDFQCLIPNNEVHSNILMLAALKTIIAQRAFDKTFEEISDKITIWSLPPQFGIDALNSDISRQVVFEKYKDFWMPKSSALKYIYVPFIDDIFHWFLMVVFIDEGEVYKLDSYPNPDRDISKNFVMRWTLELLNYILCSPYSATKVLENKDLPIDNWPFNKARGIPDCKTSDDSPIWLLKWMAMEDMFQSNLTTRPPDAQIRMLAACANLTGNHNEICHIVKNHSAARRKALVGN